MKDDYGRTYKLSDTQCKLLDYLYDLVTIQEERLEKPVIENPRSPNDHPSLYSWNQLGKGIQTVQREGRYNKFERTTLRDLRDYFYLDLKEDYYNGK